MCRFLTGIVFDDGRLLADPLIDSHTLLQTRNNLRVNYEGDKYCLVEITGDNADLDSYHLDWWDERKPDWWNSDWDSDIETRARQIIGNLIIDGNLIRGPVEEYNGTKSWYKNSKRHRDNDLPAIEHVDGAKFWYKDGKRHRDNDLPAVEWSDGTKFWCKNGQRHRDNDLPAIEWSSGSKEWWVNDERHRDNDLPAIVWSDGTKFWWVNGEPINNSQ
jgi:hypothetical protein